MKYATQLRRCLSTCHWQTIHEIAHQIVQEVCPELAVQISSCGRMLPLELAVAVKGPHGHVVDVEPDGAPPVWGVMLCIVRTMDGACQTKRPVSKLSNMWCDAWCLTLSAPNADSCRASTTTGNEQRE